MAKSVEIIKSKESNRLVVKTNEKNVDFEINTSIPDSFSEELKAFLNLDVAGENQIQSLNPLVLAVNEIQAFKDLQYNDQISEGDLEALKVEFQLDHISYDMAENKFIWDFKPEALALHTQEALDKKVQTQLDKLAAKQHKNSHQDYKDAKKVLGSFNSSLTKAKKIMKEPYLDSSKKIENIFKMFKQESDNTKLALDSNFQKCLDKEQKKKEEREAKQKEAELNKIKELSEQNKEMTEKFEAQQQERKIFTESNTVKEHIAEVFREANTNMWNYELEALENFDYNSLKNPSFFSTIEFKENVEIFDETFKNACYALKEAVKNIIVAKRAKQNAQFDATAQVVLSAQTDDSMTASDKYSLILELLENLDKQAKHVHDQIVQMDLSDNPYLQQNKFAMTSNLFPKITDMTTKIHVWAKQKAEQTENIN